MAADGVLVLRKRCLVERDLPPLACCLSSTDRTRKSP